MAVSALLLRILSRFWIFCSSSDGSHFPFRMEAVRPRIRGVQEQPSNSCTHRGQPGHSQWFCNKRNPISLKTTISPSLSDSKGGLWWPGGSHQTPPSWFSTMVRFDSSEHEGICGKSWPAPYRKLTRTMEEITTNSEYRISIYQIYISICLSLPRSRLGCVFGAMYVM